MSVEKKVPQIRFKVFNGEWEENALSETIEIIGTGKSVFMANMAITELNKFAILGSRGVIGYDCTFDYSGNFILTARVGENAGRLYKYSGEVKITDNTVFIKSDSLDFIFYLLTNFDLRRLAFGTGQPLIKASELNGLKLFFPLDRTEQTQIGNFFQKLDSLINQHQQKHDQLSNIKKAMLGKMFPKPGETIPEVRFKGFSGEWEEKELGEIGDTFTGLSGKTKHDFGHGQAGFVTYMNVFANAISNESLVDPIEIDESQNEVKKGDVFFTTSSETPQEVGMSSIWMGETRNIYLNSFCFGYRPKQKIDSLYLAYTLRADSFRKQVIFLAQGVSRYNISKTKVMDIKIRMPHFSEQETIGNYFQKIDALINQHQQQITKLTNIKQAFLSKMFV